MVSFLFSTLLPLCFHCATRQNFNIELLTLLRDDTAREVGAPEEEVFNLENLRLYLNAFWHRLYPDDTHAELRD